MQVRRSKTMLHKLLSTEELCSRKFLKKSMKFRGKCRGRLEHFVLGSAYKKLVSGVCTASCDSGEREGAC